MTTKEKLILMVWCQEAVIALKLQEAAIKIQQMEILKKDHA